MKTIRKGRPPGFDKTLKETQRLGILVGFFPEAHYPDGTPVAYVAAIHEFGYPQGNIPARSFFRPTVAQKQVEWGSQVAGAIRGALRGSVALPEAFELIGGQAAGDVSRTISKITEPPLAPETVRRKGSSKPLVDTGLLIQSVNHKVIKK